MACKEMNDSLKILNAMSLRSLREKTLDPIPLYCNNIAIEDRRSFHIFSVDPAGCTDIDDAIGLQVVDEETIISIYIANVALVLDYLNLWSHFSERVATIYLPDGKTPMLPNILADDLCSLIQEKERCAFCLDIHLNKQNEVI